jgi:threonine/homoserine/homoserine lactone efflux protein
LLGELDLSLTASLTLLVVPVPDNSLVLTQGVARGRGAVLVSAAGASLRFLVHFVFAAARLSALLGQATVAFSVDTYAGVAY